MNLHLGRKLFLLLFWRSLRGWVDFWLDLNGGGLKVSQFFPYPLVNHLVIIRRLFSHANRPTNNIRIQNTQITCHTDSFSFLPWLTQRWWKKMLREKKCSINVASASFDLLQFERHELLIGGRIRHIISRCRDNPGLVSINWDWLTD